MLALGCTAHISSLRGNKMDSVAPLISHFPDHVSSLRGTNRYSLGAEASRDDRVEELSEEVEPLGLLDLAVTVGVEAVEELLDLGVPGALVATCGKLVSSELHNFGSVDFTVAVDVELAEGFLSLLQGSSSGLSNLLLVSSGKVLGHFLFYL